MEVGYALTNRDLESAYGVHLLGYAVKI
jgi:hypothetical protein